MVADKGRLSAERFGTGLVILLTVTALSLCPAPVAATDGALAEADSLVPVPSLAPPVNVQVVDTDNDRGSQIDVSWDASADVESGRVEFYRILRSSHPDTGFAAVGRVGFTQTSYVDAGMDDETDYYYRVAAGAGEELSYSPTIGPVVSRPHWFNMGRLNCLVAVILFVLAIVIFVTWAKGGRDLFIRRLPG
ncbi:fibronectin type III domain-containing protein, partial [bacterium]|nr:fibronectin type III domain-containing protein [bacterium]